MVHESTVRIVQMSFVAMLTMGWAACSDDSASSDLDGGVPADGASDDARDDGHDHDHEHGHGELGFHIHNVQFWKDTDEIVLGTHEGVHRTQEGTADLVELIGEGDFMSFLQDPSDPNTYWGSGHNSGRGFNNWGFIESTDGGETWDEISVTSIVDFHQMAVTSAQTGLIVGTWSDTYYVSDDSGRGWDTYAGAGNPTGLLVDDPSGPVLFVASTTGINRVVLPAGTSSPVIAASVSGLGEGPSGVVYGTADANIHLCDDQVANCTTMAGPSSDAAIKFLFNPDNAQEFYVLTVGSQVFHTDDGGKTWEIIVDQEV